MNYKPIEKTFRKNGFDYQEVWREGDFAIYKQSKSITTKIWFEAVQITRHDGYEIAGNKIEPSEVYPSSEKWGLLGFTCSSLEAAHKRIDFMKNHASEIALKNKEVDEDGKVIERGQIKIKYPQNKEFCIKDLIPLNPQIKIHNFHPALQKLIKEGQIKESRRKSMGKGKPMVYYTKHS